MKKIFSFFLVALFSVTTWAGTKTLYLVPNSNWTQANARFAAYVYGSGDAWYSMTAFADRYQVTIDDKYPNIIFCRMNGSTTENNWDNKWNQTGDLTVPTDSKNCFTIPSGAWDGSTTTWSTYTPPADPTKFYITGDSALVVDAGLAAGKAWNADAIESKKDTFTLTLKANQDYKMKVVVGSAWKGFGDLTAGQVADGLNGDGDGNICFKLNAAGDVKVIYTNSLFKLIGNFYVTPTETLKLVPGLWAADGAKFGAWTWGESLAGQWSPLFSGTGDTLSTTIRATADSLLLIRFRNDVTAPRWNAENDTVEWNRIDKIAIDHTSLTYTVTDWATGQWTPYVPVVPAKFYLTGDSAFVKDAGLNDTLRWHADAIKSEKDTLILTSLKANQDYKLKVSLDGTWDDGKVLGYTDLTTITNGLSVDKDNNICFKLNAAGPVSVIKNDTLFKLTGNFYIAPFDSATQEHLKLVPGVWAAAHAKMAVYSWGAKKAGEWSAFFTGEGDTLETVIPKAADSLVVVRFNRNVMAPTWDNEAENVWNKIDKLLIDHNGLTLTITDWDAAQWSAFCAPDYGLIIDGKTCLHGTHNTLQTEWTEYMLRNVELKKDQTFKVINFCDSAQWVLPKYANQSYWFDTVGGKYTVPMDGTYDFYIKFIYQNDEMYIAQHGFYTSAVPSQCTDVMIQAFFNESYDDSKPGVSDEWQLGNTRWATLKPQAKEIGHYFDLVWLPPSGNGDGMGYHTKDYSNQNSNWGSASDLADLIDSIHSVGSKVVADIVINHGASTNGWLGFPEFDFTPYGKFQPDASYICQDDEVNTNPAAGDDYGKATGSKDDGTNWDGARDWSHDNVYVQNMFKAYLQWMRTEVGYDGFRYDKGDGFNNWHHDNYNKTAGPCIAFMECYSGTDEIQWRITQANSNIMALDFDTKWHVFDKFPAWNYNFWNNDHALGDGLLGRGDGHHAVTFIDSHDWFLRSDNQNEFAGRGNSLKPELKARLLQANAFLLSMPGIPCVFYPHWVKYKDEIKAMIAARKLAGIHNDSEVKDIDQTGTGFQATVVGKDGGYLILCLGDKRGDGQFAADFEKVYYNYSTNDAGEGHDASLEIWVKRSSSVPTAVDEISTEEPVVRGEKFFRNGQLFIRMGDKIYNLVGQQVR